jgi:hypothetical protein
MLPLRVEMKVPELADESPRRDKACPSSIARTPVVVVPAPSHSPSAAPVTAGRPSTDLAAAVPVLGTGALLAAHAALMAQWIVPHLSAWGGPLTGLSLLLATSGLAAAYRSRPRRAVRSAAVYLAVCILATLPAMLLRPAAAPAHTPGPNRPQQTVGAGSPPRGQP